MELYEQLEQELAQWSGCPNVVVCSSGSAALHLALEVFGLPPDSEVLVPDLTMVACARAVSLAKLKPVFVDCDSNLLMDLRQARKKTRTRTRAIMPVHIYGRFVDMEAVYALARQNDLHVIEDRAEAHSSELNRKVPVQPGSAACWSFYKNKIIAGEEGGAVAFGDEKHAKLARSLRSMGFTNRHNFYHVPRGWNYRMSNLHAEPILTSLHRFNMNVTRRRKVEMLYDQELPKTYRMPPRSTPWVYDVRVPGLKAGMIESIVSELNSWGVPARCCFKPMSDQEEFKGQTPSEFMSPKAWLLSQEILYLPLDHYVGVDQAEECIRRLIAAATHPRLLSRV